MFILADFINFNILLYSIIIISIVASNNTTIWKWVLVLMLTLNVLLWYFLTIFFALGNVGLYNPYQLFVWLIIYLIDAITLLIYLFTHKPGKTGVSISYLALLMVNFTLNWAVIGLSGAPYYNNIPYYVTDIQWAVPFSNGIFIFSILEVGLIHLLLNWHYSRVSGRNSGKRKLIVKS